MAEVWDNASGWLLQSAAGSGGLLLLVCALMLLTRQPVRRQRLGEWGVAAALLFAVLSLGPSWLHIRYTVPPPEAATPLATAETAAPLTEPLPPAPYRAELDAIDPALADRFLLVASSTNIEPAPAASLPTPADAPAAPPDLWDHDRLAGLLVLLYAGAAALLIARWLLGYWWLCRLVRQAQPAPAAAARIFDEMAAGLTPVPRLRVARRLRVPVSCGLWRPTVLLPKRWCAAHRAAELRWVFAHELTHLQRRDAWSCLLFGLAQALFFYLPWFWWLRRQVRLCQEYVADAAAAEQPAPVEDYAQFLLNLTTAPAVPLGATGVLGNTSDLFRRVTMLLKSPVSVEKRCPSLWLWAVAGSLVAVAVFASGLGLRAEPGEPALPKFRGQTEPADAGVPYKIRIRLADAPGDPETPNKKPGDRDGDKKPAKDELAPQIEQLKKMLKELPANDLPEVRRALEKALADLAARQAEQQRRLAEVKARLVEVSRDKDVLYFVRGADARLGAIVEPPSAVLVDQLGLAKGEGQVVIKVLPESAAAKAGLQPNDILLVLGGKTVTSDPREFTKLLDGLKAKEELEAIVFRKGKKETVKGLVLADKSERPKFDLFVPGVRAVPGVPAVPAVPFNLPLPGPNMIPLPGGGQGIFQIAGPQQNAVITTTIRTPEGFTTRHQEGSLIITLTGTVKDGKSKVGEIHIQDGRESHKVETLDKVPKQYQDRVKSLVDLHEKTKVEVEIELKKR